MNLQPSADQQELAAAAREWLARELPVTRLGALPAGPGVVPDEQTWARCAELGWLGLGLPERYGGLGLGAAEEIMLFRELGRQLAPGPFASSVVAAHAVGTAGADDLASQIVAGRLRVGTVTGEHVIDASVGDLAVRVDEDGAQLEEMLEVDPAEPVDPSVRVGRIRRARQVIRVDDRLLPARARLLCAAELLGVIEAVRDMSVAYASVRTQFNRPIGTFQAVKHRCADMAVAAYAATGQLHVAALYIDARRDSAPFHAAAAYLVAARGAATSTADNIQNLGGIAFTWEHQAHLYLKRAMVASVRFGPLRSAHQVLMNPARHEFE